MSTEALREAITSRVRGAGATPAEVGTPSPDAALVGEGVRAAGGSAVQGILFFGSRKTRARPDPFSAYDLVVAVSRYGPFYESLRATGKLRRSPRLVSFLNRLLPPNQISLVVPRTDGEASRAKCAVVSVDTLTRETSAARRDHFLIGRLFQPTEILYAADAASRERLVDALTSAHRLTYSWVRPWLPERFDAALYARTLLKVSFRGEIRPEPEGRSEALFAAQQDYLVTVYAVLLAELAAKGELLSVGTDTYALAQPVRATEALRRRAYFTWSLLRATTRWAKYVVTFDDWLEFIVRKARRHSGQDIVL
ncbi:MAG: hypothetical protein ACREBE_19275, partial [bacterium]